MVTERGSDVIVYGATGFVGRLTAAYLAAHAPPDTRIGLAGRSQERLEAVRAGLGPAAQGWPIVVADSRDREALAALASSTRVVATTVGPYARYGSDVVEACVDAGTDYADLTGEVLFVRDCIDRFHQRALTSGSRIVHSCGYDSVPSDLGVLLIHQQAVADGVGELGETVLAAKGKGGASGGTIDSMRAQMEAVAADRTRRSILADPYALSPDRPGEPDLGPQPDTFAPRRDPLLGEWSAPFVMGPYNTRIVRRSNALTEWSYGRTFRYREVMAFGDLATGAAIAAGVTGGLAAMMGAMSFAPTRSLLDRVLPKPGSGPSQRTMDRGSFRSDVHSMTTGGAHYHAVVAGDGDPGYKATAVMLGESCLALAIDRDRLPERAGVLTPATALGAVLIERLRSAGFRAEITAAAD